MTWNGRQGFHTPIQPDSFAVDNMGTFGTLHQERGLTCKWCIPYLPAADSSFPMPQDVEFSFSGHMTPRESVLGMLHTVLILVAEFVPWAAFQTIAFLLGKRDSPSA